MKHVRILGIDFDLITYSETIEWVKQWIQDCHKGYLCTVNVAIMVMVRSDPKLKIFFDHASLTVADGQPIVWVSKLFREKLPERVTGIDLVYDLCSLAEKERYRVYFLGACDKVIKKAVEALQDKYPRLNVVGYDHGYFLPGDAESQIKKINDADAQILFIGMGHPKQEYLLADNWQNLGVNLALPVGGSFDVIAGKFKRAPKWMQNSGLEWVYRLWQEPGRLWKRYFWTNIVFIYLLIREGVLSLFNRRKGS